MKKILYVITKSNWGGAQRYVFDLATNLPKDQFETIVACGGSGPLFQKLSENGIRTISIPHLKRNINIMKEVLSLFSLWQILKKEKPDIIHLNSSKVGGLGAIAARTYNLQLTTNNKTKIIFTAHGWPFNEDRFFLSQFIIWFLSWLTAVFSTEVIVLTKNDLASTIKFLFLPDNKFCLIPNGIDTDAISFFPQEQARKELGLELEPSAIIIGGITEFTKNKGVQYLIEAAKALPKSVRVAFISGGERKSQMEKFAKDFGVSERIHFLGFKQDAAKYLKAFDIFVFPSIKEGLPYSLLEAGLAELSIVASNVGGIPDIITNEENGLLVEPKSSHALAKAIKKLLENKEKREQFGKKISEKIKTDFSFASMLEKTIEIYKTNQS